MSFAKSLSVVYWDNLFCRTFIELLLCCILLSLRLGIMNVICRV